MYLLTLKGDFTLSSVSAGDIVDLIVTFQAGLTERSQYAVALQEVNRQGQPPLRSLFGLLIPTFTLSESQICANILGFMQEWYKMSSINLKATNVLSIFRYTLKL